MRNAIEWAAPRYSQRRELKNKRWRRRGCGVVAFKMMCDFHRPGADVSLPRLITDVVQRDGYLRNVGWKHRELAAAAALYGLHGQHFDWAGEPHAAALAKLKALLRRGPIVLSVWRDPKAHTGGHLVTAVGFNASSVLIHDPDGRTPETIRRRIMLPQFKSLWKQRAIVVFPRVAKRK